MPDRQSLPAIAPKRLTGNETFHHKGQSAGFDLRGFWQWAASDLVGNTLRGLVAEFLVAQALGVAGGVRAEWDAYDCVTADGLKVEVKSSAYLQSWKQSGHSAIRFGIRPTLGWDARTNEFGKERRRQAVVSSARYVTFQMAEVAVPQRLFQTILRRISRLMLPLLEPG